VTEARARSVATGGAGLAEPLRCIPDTRPELLLDRRPGNRLPRAPLRLLRHKAGRLCRHIDCYPGRYVPRAACAALALLIAYQGATLYSVIATPLDDRPGRAVPPPRLQPAASLSSFDPFFTAAAVSGAPIASAGLTLHGLRQDRRTGGGSAIVSQSDGAQRSFATGEEIAPGIVLKQVGSDHVTIVRNGMEERLGFSEFESKGAGALPTVRQAPPPYQLTPPASPAAQTPARRPAQRAPALPPRSINFADPTTLPATLTGGSAVANQPPAPKR
jgi:general secretion pathway protein C